jgi:hypothetical protein
MGFFLQWIVPLLILIASLIITLLLPVDKQTQVAAPLVVGIFMFVLNSLLRVPDVVIADLKKRVSYLDDSNSLKFTVRGQLVNRSSTGFGDLKSIYLRIPLSNGEILDIEPMRSEQNLIGYRFNPHGVWADKWLQFERYGMPRGMTLDDLVNRDAQIILNVVGQSSKKYQVHITK